MKPKIVDKRTDSCHYSVTPPRGSNMTGSAGRAEVGFWTPQLLRSPLSNSQKRASLNAKHVQWSGRIRTGTRAVRSLGHEEDRTNRNCYHRDPDGRKIFNKDRDKLNNCNEDPVRQNCYHEDPGGRSCYDEDPDDRSCYHEDPDDRSCYHEYPDERSCYIDGYVSSDDVLLDNKDNKKVMHDAHMRLLKDWMAFKLKTRADESYSENSQENGMTDPPPIPPRRYNHSDLLDAESPRDNDRLEGKPPPAQDNPALVTARKPPLRRRDKILRRYKSTPPLISDDFKRYTAISPETSVNISFNNGNYDHEEGSHVFGTPRNGGHSTWNGNGQRDDLLLDAMPVDLQLSLVDIVGESYKARYPWQRDAITQCDLRCSSTDTRNSPPSQSRTSDYNGAHTSSARMKSRVRVRPQSVGELEGVYREEFGDEQRNARKGRLSDPSLTHRNHNRKRVPVISPDDPDVVSDLEAISEHHSGRLCQRVRLNSIESAAITEEISARLQCQLDKEEELSVLTSPCVSPVMWRSVPDVVVNSDHHQKSADPDGEFKSSFGSMDYLSVPRKHVRRRNSASYTEGSDDSDREISPPVARRGRRAAIVDTKNFGDVSPTNLSPNVSPSDSCEEGDGEGTVADRFLRRRSSTELTLNVYPGDLLVQEHHKKLIKRNTISDFYASRNGSTTTLNEDSKKPRQPFSLLKLMKSRSKESLTHLGDVLKRLKPSEFKDNHLAVYKNLHWSDLIASTDKQPPVDETMMISEVERKRRESVWELFKSELVFLIDHLMVLKHCFLEPLKKVQVEGFLMYAEPAEIFGNLDELCYVSYTFCKDFISSLVRDMSATEFGRTNILIKAFQRFSAHSKDGSVYHTYCLNYTNALSNLEKLRKNEDFCEFEKWCEQDQRCNRLQLADLLIGPMQHCTKLPLLLHNIKKYTEDPLDKRQIVESIEKVETSLKQLEDKMKWLKNFERVQEIQRHLVWPSVTDLDSRAFVPEYLKPKLMRQPCERLLACPRRQLLYEGAVTLTGKTLTQLIRAFSIPKQGAVLNQSTKSFDAFLFLFDDILLITKIKKPHRKKQGASDPLQPCSGQADRQAYVVHRQPIALDRLGLHDVSSQEATANGVKFAFVIIQISRFQQIIDVFTLQAATDIAKTTWLSQLRQAKHQYCNQHRDRADSMKENEEPVVFAPPLGSVVNNNANHVIISNTNNNNTDTPDCTQRRSSGSRRAQHAKALSVDAVFL